MDVVACRLKVENEVRLNVLDVQSSLVFGKALCVDLPSHETIFLRELPMPVRSHCAKHPLVHHQLGSFMIFYWVWSPEQVNL